MRQECGVKKGVYCFFTPGSASLNNEVTALAAVTTLAETHTHTEPAGVKGHPVVVLVNSERTRGGTESKSTSLTKTKPFILNFDDCLKQLNSDSKWTVHL